MAAVIAAAPAGNANGLDGILGELGQVEVDCKAILDVFAAVAATETEGPPGARLASVQNVVGPKLRFVGEQDTQIAQRMQMVSDLKTHPRVAAYRTDLELVCNHWESIQDLDLSAVLQALAATAPGAPLDYTAVRFAIAAYRQLHEQIGLFTIPKRIAGFMEEQSGVGAPLDFHARFADELDDPNDRVEVLRRLAVLNVDRVGGLVDVERGMIYRVGPLRRRLLSYAMLLVAMLAGGGIVYLLSTTNSFALPGFSSGTMVPLQTLLWWYALMMAGVAAHIVKKAAELSIVARTGGSGDAPQVILDRLAIWIHVREYRFVTTILTAIGAFVMLVASGQANASTALLAGYTIDSLADLVLQRFNTAVSTHAAEVKQALSASVG
jgi:hypothetical protein